MQHPQLPNKKLPIGTVHSNKPTVNVDYSAEQGVLPFSELKKKKKLGPKDSTEGLLPIDPNALKEKSTDNKKRKRKDDPENKDKETPKDKGKKKPETGLQND